MLQIVLFRLARSTRGFAPRLSSASFVVPNSDKHSIIQRCTLHSSSSIFGYSKNNPPPDFSIVDDDDDDEPRNERAYDAPDFDLNLDDDGEVSVRRAAPTKPRRVIRQSQASPQAQRYPSSPPPRRQTTKSPSSQSSSWMDRNNDYTGENNKPSKTFREDFRGTRVFVQNLPPTVSWQDLKDHFRIAGDVVFASISTGGGGSGGGRSDAGATGATQCGIVQYETTDMAQHAIATMSEHPLDGYTLFVRKDVQESKEGARLRESSSPRVKGPTPPTKWKCADDDAHDLNDDEVKAVQKLIKERDFARRKKDYALSDEIRAELKLDFGVHIDDRLKMWWTGGVDGKQVPASVQEIKGDGRWGLKPWHMIPTTPENDACVNPDLVNGLLAQRDIARREQDFATADALLLQARESPDGELSLRIHDESRSWRIWTDEAPKFLKTRQAAGSKKSPVEQCLEITQEFAPERLEEIKTLLEHFPGREYNILKKLKKQFDL
jgi:hypothetical protein